MMKITPDIAELMGAYMEGGQLTQEEQLLISDAIGGDNQLAEIVADQFLSDYPVDVNTDYDNIPLEGMLAMDFLSDSPLNNDYMDTFNHDGVIGIPGNEYQQQYSDTCAIKSQQIILNEFGIPVTEDQLVNYSHQHGWYNGHGTSMEDVGNLLEEGGVPIHRQENSNVFDLVAELAQGHKVIVGVDADELWGSRFQGWMEDFYMGEVPDHALIVSGIDTRDPNHVMVLVTDPGTGDHNKAYPLDQFMDAWADSQCYMVATDIPAPDSLPEMANFDYSVGHIETVAGMDYLQFEIFEDLSHGLPIWASDDHILSPMASLVDAYSDVANNSIPFAQIFGDYDFNRYLDTDVVNDYFAQTYEFSQDHINFSPEMSWDTYADTHDFVGLSNSDYADFLNESIDYFDAIGDIDSSMYCSQQMLIVDYCDSNNIDFLTTFFC